MNAYGPVTEVGGQAREPFLVHVVDHDVAAGRREGPRGSRTDTAAPHR